MHFCYIIIDFQVIFRLPSIYNNCSGAGLLRDPSIYTADASMFQHQGGIVVNLGQETTKGSKAASTPVKKLRFGKIYLVFPSKITVSPSCAYSNSYLFLILSSSSDKDSVESSGKSAHAAPSSKGGDVLAATFLDVAVLRCLFVSQWQEEGVYWALHYIYNRYKRSNAAQLLLLRPPNFLSFHILNIGKPIWGRLSCILLHVLTFILSISQYAYLYKIKKIKDNRKRSGVNEQSITASHHYIPKQFSQLECYTFQVTRNKR